MKVGKLLARIPTVIKHAHCTDLGLQCTEDELSNHNGEVDTSEKVLGLIKQLGGTITAEQCLTNYGSATATPNFKEDICYTSGIKSVFSCNKIAGPANANKQRLCYTDKQ